MLLHPSFDLRQLRVQQIDLRQPAIERCAAGHRQFERHEKGPSAFPEQVAVVVRDALAMQNGLNAALDAGAQLDQGRAIPHAFAELTNFGCREIAFRKDPAEPKATEAVGIHAISFGLILGQHPDGRGMAQMRIQTQFVQEVSDPRPAERTFHRHGSSRRQFCEIIPHRRPISMFQAHSLHNANLPLLTLHDYTQLAELPMDVPAHRRLSAHSYLRRVWSSRSFPTPRLNSARWRFIPLPTRQIGLPPLALANIRLCKPKALSWLLPCRRYGYPSIASGDSLGRCGALSGIPGVRPRWTLALNSLVGR